MLSCGMLHQLKNNFMYADDCEREHSKSEEASREHTPVPMPLYNQNIITLY